jgi:hypothetical protein
VRNAPAKNMDAPTTDLQNIAVNMLIKPLKNIPQPLVGSVEPPCSGGKISTCQSARQCAAVLFVCVCVCVCLQMTVNRMGVRKAVSVALIPVLRT